MLLKFKTANEAFKDEKTCLEFITYSRWGDKIKCAHCNHEKVYKFKDGKRYKCASPSCKKIFTAKTNTIFEHSNIKLTVWMNAANLIAGNGMSSHQLAKHIGVTQKTAWFMLHRLRSGAFNNGGIFKSKLGKNDAIVEVDETFVGGKNKNRHADKKVKNSQGRSYKDKIPVLGMLERGGKVKVATVPDTKRKSVLPIIKKNIVAGSKVMSDEWHAYATLSYIGYDHQFVNHGARQYVDGEVHTNSIENFWSHFKRRLGGVYIKVSKKHMRAYAEEAAFRYNTRNMTQRLRLFLLFHNSVGGGVLYKDLIADAA